MYNNFNELVSLIREGYSNDEIIKGRLDYLKSSGRSKNYKSGFGGIRSVLFYRGFIPSDLVISKGLDYSYKYYFDDLYDLYNDLLNMIRRSKDVSTVDCDKLVSLINNYFEDDSDLKYSKLLYVFRENMGDEYVKKNLPIIIYEYENSNYDGDLLEFGIARSVHYGNMEATNMILKNLGDKYYNCLRSTNIDLDVVIPISSLKGTGSGENGFASSKECAMIMQNCLTFLGFESYMLGGIVSSESEDDPEHNFNVYLDVDNSYVLVDSYNLVSQRLVDISNVSDLSKLNDVNVVNLFKKNYSYNSGSFGNSRVRK